MASIEIPTKEAARTKDVELKVSTGKGEAKTEATFKASMPASLADAVALEGEKPVFRRYLNSLAIELQGIERAKLSPEGEKKERKRASYLDELGV